MKTPKKKLSDYEAETGNLDDLNKIFHNLRNKEDIEITSTSISFKYKHAGVDIYVMSISWNYYE